MAHSKTGWIGCDLDGTLALYNGWKGIEHIGDPIPPMVERVKQWLEEGKDVRIFTARVYKDGTPERNDEADRALVYIISWCVKHFGRQLPVTCTKDLNLIEYWDDRAVQVIPNTGQAIQDLIKKTP